MGLVHVIAPLLACSLDSSSCNGTSLKQQLWSALLAAVRTVMSRPSFGANEVHNIVQTLLVILDSVGSSDVNRTELYSVSLDVALAIISCISVARPEVAETVVQVLSDLISLNTTTFKDIETILPLITLISKRSLNGSISEEDLTSFFGEGVDTSGKRVLAGTNVNFTSGNLSFFFDANATTSSSGITDITIIRYANVLRKCRPSANGSIVGDIISIVVQNGTKGRIFTSPITRAPRSSARPAHRAARSR